MKQSTESFFHYVNKTDGCWNWTGSRNQKGYGTARFASLHPKERKAHRISWMIHFGEIPDGLHVLHECDNTACVNPDHLWLGTNYDNSMDRVKKKRGAVGERSGNSKTTEFVVREMRSLYDRGHKNISHLSRHFGMSVNNASSIIHRQTWKHVA